MEWRDPAGSWLESSKEFSVLPTSELSRRTFYNDKQCICGVQAGATNLKWGWRSIREELNLNSTKSQVTIQQDKFDMCSWFLRTLPISQVTGQSHHIVTLLTAVSKYLVRSNSSREGLSGLTVPQNTVHRGRGILEAVLAEADQTAPAIKEQRTPLFNLLSEPQSLERLHPHLEWTFPPQLHLEPSSNEEICLLGDSRSGQVDNRDEPSQPASFSA